VLQQALLMVLYFIFFTALLISSGTMCSNNAFIGNLLVVTNAGVLLFGLVLIICMIPCLRRSCVDPVILIVKNFASRPSKQKASSVAPYETPDRYWRESFSKARGCKYWVNTKTGDVEWSLPKDLAEKEAAKSSALESGMTSSEFERRWRSGTLMHTEIQASRSDDSEADLSVPPALGSSILDRSAAHLPRDGSAQQEAVPANENNFANLEAKSTSSQSDGRHEVTNGKGRSLPVDGAMSVGLPAPASETASSVSSPTVTLSGNAQSDPEIREEAEDDEDIGSMTNKAPTDTSEWF